MNTPTVKAVTVGVVDDNPRDRQRIIDMLHHYQTEHPTQFTIREFEDGAALLDNYQPDYDVLFLDIQMDGIDGMRAAASIRKVDSSVILIFVTKTAQYATSGYAVQAQGYLLKPVSDFAFDTELTRSLKQLKRLERDSILVGSATAPRRVDVADILYIESRRHRLTVHTVDDAISFNGTLKDYEELLTDHSFYRSNSGYLVSLRHVIAVDKEDCIMSNGDPLKISRSRKKGLFEGLTHYLGGKVG